MRSYKEVNPWRAATEDRSPRCGIPEREAYSQPAVDVAMTYAATLAMSSSERRPPNAGLAFLPLVTCFITAFSLKPPSRYSSSAAFSRVFSGMMTFWPPAWHAAQLPENTDSPAAASPAKAGMATSESAAAAPAAATLESKVFDTGAEKARAAVRVYSMVSE